MLPWNSSEPLHTLFSLSRMPPLFLSLPTQLLGNSPTWFLEPRICFLREAFPDGLQAQRWMVTPLFGAVTLLGQVIDFACWGSLLICSGSPRSSHRPWLGTCPLSVYRMTVSEWMWSLLRRAQVFLVGPISIKLSTSKEVGHSSPCKSWCFQFL